MHVRRIRDVRSIRVLNVCLVVIVGVVFVVGKERERETKRTRTNGMSLKKGAAADKVASKYLGQIGRTKKCVR